ncbi:MAG: hypothetical protein ACJ8FP_16045, partial [Xanthobacteraceae bacterium]
MIPAELGFDASAILLWFPSGEVPTDEDFKPRDEDPRAEKYWFRHEAVLDAVHAAVKGRRPPGQGDSVLRVGIGVSAIHALGDGRWRPG